MLKRNSPNQTNGNGTARQTKSGDKPDSGVKSDSKGQQRKFCLTRHGQPLVTTATLRGLPVKNEAGEELGVLKELMIETTRGSVAYGVLLFEDEKSFAIPYNAMQIDTELKEICIALEREVLETGSGLLDLDDTEQ